MADEDRRYDNDRVVDDVNSWMTLGLSNDLISERVHGD